MLKPRQVLFKLANKASYLYKFYLLRDPFLTSVKKWFSDQGDQTLRLNYQLNKSSFVFDVGGYLGDYADEVYRKFGCRIYLFEPVSSFFQECVKRFGDKPSVVCLNYGLSSISGWFTIYLNKNESSFKNIVTGGMTQQAKLRSISEVVAEMGIEKIDLMKINIEGGEFDLLPAIIDSGLIIKIKYLQVQFHKFDSNAVDARLHIRRSLERTHREMWNYEFVWESWELL